MSNKPKYMYRVYSTKASAERANKKYGGNGVYKVDIRPLYPKIKAQKGWAIKW